MCKAWKASKGHHWEGDPEQIFFSERITPNPEISNGEREAESSHHQPQVLWLSQLVIDGEKWDQTPQRRFYHSHFIADFFLTVWEQPVKCFQRQEITSDRAVSDNTFPDHKYLAQGVLFHSEAATPLEMMQNSNPFVSWVGSASTLSPGKKHGTGN